MTRRTACRHCAPRNERRFRVEEGQRPLDIALAFFEKPLRFRGLLAQAEEDDLAEQLNDADLTNAARQIRELYAAARGIPAA